MWLEAVQEIINKLPDDDRGELSDGYHTFNELYEHRIALFSLLVNLTLEKYKWIKSMEHWDWTVFDGWFIVMGYINGKQVSYHLPKRMRDVVKCPWITRADKWDWHKPEDVVKILLSEANICLN